MADRGEYTLVGRVRFIGTEAGGRKTPALANEYHGQFFFEDTDCDAIHKFDANETVPFNKEITEYVWILNPAHLHNIRVGTVYLIREGPHTVAYGQVVALGPSPGT
jgi:translation elongation factor EF-Tu-like GTPase